MEVPLGCGKRGDQGTFVLFSLQSSFMFFGNHHVVGNHCVC